VSFEWTVERTDELRKLWASGLSGRQIAARLGGVTRNAVLGKVHRLELGARCAGPQSDPGKARQRKTELERLRRQAVDAPRRVRKHPWLGVPVEVVQPTSEPQTQPEEAFMEKGVALMELDDIPALPSMCRWPFGDIRHGEITYCGHKPIDGYPYCCKHCARAFAPPRERRRVA
jgi:GcrA cell cycle regulator